MSEHDRAELDFLLRDSIEHHFRGFEVYYQPQVLRQSGSLYGAEALARWSCGKYGAVGPAEFIPVLEKNGRIVELGRWIFEQAALQCSRWCRIQPDFHMSVNLSCRYLEKADMCWFAKKTLKRLGLSADNMMLELTESWPLYQEEIREKAVLDLQKTGIRLAIDDFGSGYSSLLSLQKFPFHLVKLDRDFIKGVTQENGQRTLIPSLIQLCHNIGRQVCLEGVETKEEYEAVKKMEIEILQGYYFGRPVPAREFEQNYLM